MKRRLISYICLISIFIESTPINALSNITSEVITSQNLEESTEQEDNTEVKDVNLQTPDTKENLEDNVSNIDTLDKNEERTEQTDENTTETVIEDWTIESEGSNTITIGRYVGDETNIVIPRTLKGKSVVLDGNRKDIFPNNVETIKVAEAKDNESNVVVRAWPYIECFHNKVNLREADLTGLDVSNINFMLNLFIGCSSLETIDITGWNTSNVSNMQNMFSECPKLTEIKGIEGLNVSRVDYMPNMFHRCKSLKKLDLSKWDMQSVTGITSMFYQCSSLESISLKDWNMPHVNSLKAIFSGCSKLTTLDLSGWNIPSVIYMSCMFKGCSSLRNVNLGNLNTGQDINMEQMFYGCTSLENIPLQNFKSNNMGEIFRECSSLTTANLTGWNVENATNISNIFRDCTQLTSVDVSNFTLPKVSFNMNEIFRGCNTLTTINGIENWDTSLAASMVNEFYKCTSLQSINLGNLEVGNSTDMTGMFSGCSNLETVTIKVVNTNGESSIVNNSERTQSGISMNEMFRDCTSLTNIIGIKEWDTSNVTNMYRMFRGCSNLKSIDISGLETSSVNNLEGMFEYCSKLTEIKGIEDLDVSNVTRLGWMFKECSSLTNLDLNKWNTSKVVSIQDMFHSCSNLSTLLINNWNTSNINVMQGTFCRCTSLESINLSNWNTENVTNMSWMFANAKKLNYIDLSSFNLDSVTETIDMFNINLPEVTPTSTSDSISDRSLLVIANDEKLKEYNYKEDNRVPSKLTFDANGGSFSENTEDTNENVCYSREIFVIEPVESQSLIQTVDNLVSKEIKSIKEPTKSGYIFDKWVLRDETEIQQTKTSEDDNQKEQLTPEQINQIFKKLNGVYEATWVSSAINVTVPTNIPFQVVTNLNDKSTDSFISGVLNIKNNNTKRPVKVSVKSFTKDDTTIQDSKIHKLQLVDPNTYDWDNISSQDSMTKMALGMYVKSGLTGRPQYIKEDPLWLKPNEVNDVPLGIIPNAESSNKPYECKLSFTSKHGKNFIGGRAKGKFNLIFRFE